MNHSNHYTIIGTLSVLLLLSSSCPATQASTWSYGVDVWTAVDQSTFQCVYNSGYSIAFIRIYTPDSGGKNDTNAVNNVVNALNVSLGVEVFVQTPPLSRKSGAMRFDESYGYMDDNWISFGTIWLLVSGLGWDRDGGGNFQNLK